MNRTLLIILAVAGGLGALCCVGSVAVLALAADGPETGSPTDQEPGAAGGSTRGEARGPTGLEGTWMNGSASLTSYQNVVTGEFAPPSGTGELYELKPGGSCVRSAMLQSTVYSCTSYIFTWWDDCSWQLDGDTLTIELGGGTLRTRMCGGEVKEGAAKAMTLSYRATLSSDGANTWLSLTGPDGAETRYRRE